MIEVDRKNTIVELDLGYRGTISFSKELINNIREKRLVGKRTMYGMRGKEYKHFRYTASKICIGKINFSNLIMEDEPIEFLQDSIIGGGKHEKISGRLGWELFKTTNLFLDFPNSKIAFCDSALTLEKKGYPMDKFVKIPLHTERGFVEMYLDGSQEKWVLDTGSTWNFVNVNSWGKSIEEIIGEPDNKIEKSLRIQNVDLGPVVFRQIPISLPIEVDVILGMEFLKQHQVFIDFSTNQLYFSTGSSM